MKEQKTVNGRNFRQWVKFLESLNFSGDEKVDGMIIQSRMIDGVHTPICQLEDSDILDFVVDDETRIRIYK